MNLRTQLYTNYRYKIYPHISDFRGAWRISRELRELAAKGIETVDENEATSVFEYEWDNLVVLDACRHDLWEEVFGETESRITVGSNTREFIEKTFADRDNSDIVLVTANPQYADHKLEKRIGESNPFHVKFDLYNTDWDEELGTVRPEKVTEKILTASKLYPDKKIVAHYLQPHYPFLDSETIADGTVRRSKQKTSIWNLAEKGKVSRSEVWKAYSRNLEILREDLDKISGMEGRTIITSDHGNLVGENGLYGHPGNIEKLQLRKVAIKHLENLLENKIGNSDD